MRFLVVRTEKESRSDEKMTNKQHHFKFGFTQCVNPSVVGNI